MFAGWDCHYRNPCSNAEQNGMTPFMFAATGGAVNAMAFLLRHGVDINDRDHVRAAA